MKFIFSLLIPIISFSAIFGQVSILNANLNEFNVTANSLSQITVSNMGAAGTARIEVLLTNSANNTLVSATSGIVEIKSGANIFGNHNLSFSAVSYSSTPQGNYIKNLHRLPSGAFNYCVKLTAITGIEEGDEFCQSINTTENENLLLVYPNDEEVIVSTTPILMWMHTEAFNLLSPGEFFKITLVEQKEGQEASEAIIENVPVYVKNYVSSHQVQYPLDAKHLEAGKSYAWQVQKIANSNILASTETWSFSLEENAKPEDHMYIALKKKLDGSIYYPVDDKIYFRFDERYKSTAADCKIYSDKRTEIIPIIESEQEQGDEGAKSAGYNSYELDLKPYKLKKGYYTLESFNEKKEKFQLKFYVEK